MRKAGSLSVAMLGHKRIPSREGGVEIVVEALATRMAARGVRVTCFNRRGRPVAGAAQAQPAARSWQGVTLRSVPTLDAKGLAALTSSAFAAVRAAFGRYDVVHFHAEGPCAMLWLPKLFGKRCIATIHGLDWAREKWAGGLGSRYIRLGERVAACFADEVIVLSQEVQRYFRSTYGRETHWIPNGVTAPTPRAADFITATYGLTPGSYLLFVGRLVPEKGLRCLLSAFAGVRTQKRLVIAGGASDSDAFVAQLQAQAQADSRVLFTGFVQGAPLEELYSNAYLYTLPSDLEGMPLSLLEAMSYGNCCVVSDIPECTEVVDGHAAVFPHGDGAALRALLQQLCDMPAVVDAYREGAAAYILSRYPWDEVVSRTLSLYQPRGGATA